MVTVEPTDLVDLSERDLRALHVFRVVAEAGGLTAAEGVLKLERSTISRHIKALEERLGSVICQRGPRGFELTEFGRDVFAAAVSLGDAMDEMRSRLGGARRTIRGELRIGLADNCLSNPHARIAETIRSFSDAAPAVELTVTIGAPGDLLRALVDRRIHMCISGAPLRDPRFDADPLFREEFRLYLCTDGDPPHMSELRDRGFGLVVRSAETTTAGIRSTVLSELVQVHAVGLEAVATLIATGRYTGLLPTHYADSLSGRFAFREVAGAERLSRTVRFSIMSERSRPPTGAMRCMREIAVAVHAARL